VGVGELVEAARLGVGGRGERDEREEGEREGAQHDVRRMSDVA
jgi:hypothetical protein